MKNNLRTFIIYSIKSVKFLWGSKKEYLILIFISTILTSINSFPIMYLTSRSIDLLTMKVDFPAYMQDVCLLIFFVFSLSIVSMLINSRLGYVKKQLYTKIKLDIDDICLHTDYANIQSKRFLENKEFALAAMSNDSLNLFINSMRSLISSLLTMAGVLYILADVSFIILIPFTISIGMKMYYDYLNARKNFIDTKDDVEYKRKASYLQSISCDFSFAKEIRLFCLKERFQQRMDEVDQLLFNLKESRRKENILSLLLYYFSDTFLDIAMYIYFGYHVIITSVISLGQFSLYTNALWQLKSSINNILYIMTNFVVNTEYLKGFFEFIALKEKCDISTTETERISCAEIQFENVSFRYPEADEDTLKNINITINAGETLLVVGENGAGKSTFIKLLCGLYKPTSGRILFNGVDISTIDKRQYMRQISAVFQDYVLFAMSISDNVCALRDKNGNKISDALQQVNLLDKVNLTGEKLDTQLYRQFDKNGVEFSGGEMQRLAIARAIYKDTPILILDEPTSALDPKAEYEVYSSFKNISKNRTAVYISHRLSSIKFSDKIAVFNNGQIVEYGTHENLMQKNGVYAELYTIQASLYQKEVRE